MVITVLGGLQTDPKFVEKESIAPHLAKIDSVPVSAAAFLNSQNVDRPFSLISSAVHVVSPPSVEKYVLTGSFLI
jgi:hypothetical protein